MLFNSLDFLIFFPIVVVIYFAVPHRFRWVLLLIASYYFYMSWRIEYALLLVASTLIDYFAGIRMERCLQKAQKRKYLIFSLVGNLGLLFTFKYFNFFSTFLQAVCERLHIAFNPPLLNILLPIGISFYTFQSLSYTIEVYRGNQKAEHHLGIFALYVSFFPQLVAGPIERAQNLLSQFYQKHLFEYERVTDGLKLMAWGMFKKVVIADRLAVFVDTVYGNPSGFQGIHFIEATFFFAIQIYCDFSGYSDIAIGTARVMGFKLMNNFERPYFSKSIREFWQRWHISLSTWFRDYLYIPLGGSRVTLPRWCVNILITFLLSGLWHGAKWTFLAWGFLHAVYILSGWITEGVRAKIYKTIRLDTIPWLHGFLKIVTTFSLTCFAWIFFRAESIHDAVYICTHLFTGVPDFFKELFTHTTEIHEKLNMLYLTQPQEDFNIVMLLIVFLIIVELAQRSGSIIRRVTRQPIWIRWALYYILVFSILHLRVASAYKFIYFQF